LQTTCLLLGIDVAAGHGKQAGPSGGAASHP
jgi:hypothetical protein